MAQNSTNKKVANSLVAAGTAAVLAVYAAGYARTRSAADQFDAQSAERRPAGQEGRGFSPSVAVAPTLANNAEAPKSTTRPDSTPGDHAAAAQVASLDRAPVMVTAPSTNQAMPAASNSSASAPSSESAPAPAAAPPAPAPATQASSSAPAPSAPAVATSTPAPAVATNVPPQAAPPAPKWKDGMYLGWGTCRHGDIQAQVVIEGGRIMSATIAQCLTRYSCDVIGRLLPEVAQRQSAEVDYVSGATQSTYAFYYAVTEALGKAK